MFEDLQKKMGMPLKADAFIRSRLNVKKIESGLSPKTILISKRSSLFGSMLEKALEPNLSAKELIEKIVRCALDIEFGSTFTLSMGFDKMVSAIADTIVTNPELRRQALAIASIYISKKTETTGVE